MTEHTEYVVERKPTALVVKCPVKDVFEQREVEQFLVQQVITEAGEGAWTEKRRKIAVCYDETTANSLCGYLNSLEASMAEAIILSIIRLYVSTECFGPPRLVAMAAE